MLVGVLSSEDAAPRNSSDADGEAVLLAVSEGGGLPGVAGDAGGVVHGDGGEGLA